MLEVQEAGEFLAVLLFVGALLLTQVAPFKSYRFLPAELGRRARRLQRDFALERRRKYPTVYPALALPGLSHAVTVAMVLWFAIRAARAAALAGGRSVAAQVLDMLRLGFTQGVDAKSYYVHDLYRLSPADAVQQTMTRVETKNGLNRALQNLREDAAAPGTGRQARLLAHLRRARHSLGGDSCLRRAREADRLRRGRGL